MDKPCYIEWPVGMLELGFITEEEFDEYCIQLLKSMYGNVDAALKFFKTYKEHVTKVILLNQSRADPCVFIKKDDQGRVVLLATVFVDDTVLLGIRTEIDRYKTEITKRFGYTDLGKLTKHLGVWYDELRDKNGERYIVATMPQHVNGIIKTYEDHTGEEAKEFETPGSPGKSTEKFLGEAHEPEMYRKIVGKIMYLVTKLYPEGSNAARELARQFGNPSKEHWKELERFIGYLKKNKHNVKLTYRKPKDLRVLSNVDSNYATNKEDRRSVSGAIHTIGGTIVNWISKTQESVTMSSTEAEYVSMASGACEVKFLQQLLNEIAFCTMPGILLEDNTGAIYLVRNQQVGQRTKHIDVRWHFIRELYERKELTVKFVRSENNEADINTKNVPVKILNVLAENIREGNLNARRNWDQIIHDIDDDAVYLTNASVQREDVEKWIRNVCETYEEEGSVRRVCFNLSRGTQSELSFYVD
jgi:hypothetical protein